LGRPEPGVGEVSEDGKAREGGKEGRGDAWNHEGDNLIRVSFTVKDQGEWVAKAGDGYKLGGGGAVHFTKKIKRKQGMIK